MKKVYPGIFTKTEDGYLVEVPDMNVLTQGGDMADAIAMARDAIGLAGITMEDREMPLPEATEVTKMDLQKGTFADEGESIVSLIDIDFTEYRKAIDNKAVRRNVTLPSWMNKQAEKEHINVSKVLQEALMERLGSYGKVR